MSTVYPLGFGIWALGFNKETAIDSNGAAVFGFHRLPVPDHRSCKNVLPVRGSLEEVTRAGNILARGM